jgi:RNA polymerase sigma factor (sigma-70 family)
MSDARAVGVHTALLYHFCRLRLPGVALPLASFEQYLARAFDVYRARESREQRTGTWPAFIEALYPVDWFLACACLDGVARAWESLFAARASRTDCLLVDALRARAVRLYARDPERQEQAVNDFWGFLLAGERDGATPILARYDGLRPLVPWLIRVFQNKHLSEKRVRPIQGLSDEELEAHAAPLPEPGDGRWLEEFRTGAREWLDELSDEEVLILGLRLRYRLSQREVAGLLGIHEGNIGRKTDKLSKHCRDRVGEHLQRVGWTGDDLGAYVMKEMDSLLLDEPRFSADRLAALLAARGKHLPQTE